MKKEQEMMRTQQKQSDQCVQFTEENIGIEIRSNLKNTYDKYVSIKKPIVEHKNPLGPQRYEESKKELSMFDGLNFSCCSVIGCETIPTCGSEALMEIYGEPEIEITFSNPENEKFRAKILRNHANVVKYSDFIYFKLADQRKSHQDFCNSLLLQLQEKMEIEKKRNARKRH
jgi:hypothetical protein